MEELLALVYLYREGLTTEEKCLEKLDELFLEDQENDFLLELEWNFRTIKDLVVRVWSYCGTHACDLSADAFGRVLMARLKELYHREGTDIHDFAGRMYNLWEGLPPWLQQEQPFFALCYGDDPLSWGDEAQTREIYEHAMSHYDREQTGSP